MATIRQYKNGHWQAIVRRKGQPALSKVFGAKFEAERWSRLIESEIDRGLFVDRAESERTTVGELIDRYLREVTPHKKSAASEAQRLLFLKRHFGRYSVATLQSKHVASYRDDRLREGKAGATVIKELNSLAHVVDTAILDWGLPLQVNPVRLVRLPSAGRGRDRRLSADEEARLQAACRKSRAPLLRFMMTLALETGMRLGELLALEWRHIDVAARVATLPDTKNGAARQVPLSTRAVDVLREIPRHLTNRRVFWCWSRRDSFENAWRRAVKKSGVVDFRFHDIRHEATSRFFEKQFNMMEVAAITGHKTLQMLKRYTHLKAADLVVRLA